MTFQSLVKRFENSYDKKQLSPEIRAVGVKFISKGSVIPPNLEFDEAQIPWCGAIKLASEKETVLITKENIGCPAGAIALGLVDPYEKTPLPGERKYTSLMEHSASPADFTNGFVYACKDSDHMEYSLFGENDSGRYKTLGASLNAVRKMPGVNKEIMKAVVAFPPEVTTIFPDVVILPMTPVQALRAIQGYCFINGDRFEMSTIGIRGVCGDVTAYPFLYQKPNLSFFCLGARALAGWGGSLMALGLPYTLFETMVGGMEASMTGFPFKAYPD